MNQKYNIHLNSYEVTSLYLKLAKENRNFRIILPKYLRDDGFGDFYDLEEEVIAYYYAYNIDEFGILLNEISNYFQE